MPCLGACSMCACSMHINNADTADSQTVPRANLHTQTTHTHKPTHVDNNHTHNVLNSNTEKAAAKRYDD